MRTGKIVLAGVAALATVAAVSYAVMGSTQQPTATTASQSQTSPTQAEGQKVPGDVVYELSTDASLKYDYATIDELNKSDVVDAIVKGTVTDTQDSYIEGVAYRVLTVDVQRIFRGETASRITVYEDGGYVRVKDMLPELQGRMDTTSLTPEQVENGVVDVRFLGAPHSQVGDTVLLYLLVNPNKSQGDSYQMVSSVHGRFTLDAGTGEYARPVDADRPGFENRRQVEALEGELASKPWESR